MENFKCRKISVDSVYNDPVDVRCGGPVFLGFDFFVKEEEVKDMAIFIADTMNKYGVPLSDMNVVGAPVSLSENKIWTKEKIEAAIKKNIVFISMY